jgi:hypothetical protein
MKISGEKHNFVQNKITKYANCHKEQLPKLEFQTIFSLLSLPMPVFSFSLSFRLSRLDTFMTFEKSSNSRK